MTKPPKADRTTEKFWDNHRVTLNPYSVFSRELGSMDTKCPGVYTFEWGTKKSNLYWCTLTAIMMLHVVSPVLPRSFAAFMKKTENFQNFAQKCCRTKLQNVVR